MPRARVLFDHIFALPARADAPSPGYELTYVETADNLLSEVALSARRAKEAASVPRYAPCSPWARRLRDMRQFHAWMYHEHGAYAASRLTDPEWHRPSDLEASLLETYRRD